MHDITFKRRDNGEIDVLINGFSYRIHRGMASESAANQRADEIKREFCKIGEHARVLTC